MKNSKADIPMVSFDCPACKEMHEASLDHFEFSFRGREADFQMPATCEECGDDFMVTLDIDV